MSNSLKIAIVSTMIAVVPPVVYYFVSAIAIPYHWAPETPETPETPEVGQANVPDSRADMLIYRGVVDDPAASVAKGGDR